MSTTASAQPTIRVMALHALAYCERLSTWKRSKRSASQMQPCMLAAGYMKNWRLMKARLSASSWRAKRSAFAGRLIVCAAEMVSSFPMNTSAVVQPKATLGRRRGRATGSRSAPIRCFWKSIPTRLSKKRGFGTTPIIQPSVSLWMKKHAQRFERPLLVPENSARQLNAHL